MTRSSCGILGTLGIVGLLAVGGCISAAPPSPTPVPAKPTATISQAAKPTEVGSPAVTVKPAATASESAKPVASSNVKAEWDKILAAAKLEGKVVVAGGPGDSYRNAAMPFRNAYPDIQLEFTGVGSADFAPRILAEREGGRFLWDVNIGGPQTPLTSLRPKGAIDPLKPVLLPEIQDDSKWLGSFNDGWMDKDHQMLYQFEGRLTYMAHVNRELVSEVELNSVDQLLDPRWKGKIAAQDMRVAGAAAAYNAYLLVLKGEDFLRKLLSQDLIIQKDTRLMLEGLVGGRYAVALGIPAADLQQFRKEGAANNVKPLAPDTSAGARLTSGWGNVALVNNAPHPNAAKVFVNWLLSREGQKAYVEATNLNSRRLDVEGPPEYAPRPDVKYVNIEQEQFQPNTNRGVELAKEIIQ